MDEKSGTDWEPEELDAIVADYFAMLGEELAGRPYVKSHHRAALMQQIGRSSGSIEYKHQNISAVLQHLGLPWIWGYKPAQNYQSALGDALDRYLTAKGRTAIETEIRPRQDLSHVLHAAESAGVFVQPPPLPEQAPASRPDHLRRLVRKFDPVARDFRNRELGKAGEEFVLQVERSRLVRADRPDLARKVEWVAEEQGDGAGFDVLSFEPGGGRRLIEVKTTNGALRTPFYLTRNECAVAKEQPREWQIYRVHLFAQKPAICTIRPPLDARLALRPEIWRASLG